MADAYAPVRGKCIFWRETANLEDEYDSRLRSQEKRVECSCFVEGYAWTFATADIPEDCPRYRSCRYHIRSY